MGKKPSYKESSKPKCFHLEFYQILEEKVTLISQTLPEDQRAGNTFQVIFWLPVLHTKIKDITKKITDQYLS